MTTKTPRKQPRLHFAFCSCAILISSVLCKATAAFVVVGGGGGGVSIRRARTGSASSAPFPSLRLGSVPSDDDDGESSSSSEGTTSTLTDWVVENLEGGEGGESITSESATKAGEGDTLPAGGLRIGRFRILPSGLMDEEDGEEEIDEDSGEPVRTIRLLLGRNGWGTGVHPTTRLCLEWLSRADVLLGGERILDYGCGSGILSIAALSIGSSAALGVDVEAEALISSERNAELNGVGEKFGGSHVREVLPRSVFPAGGGADVCVANILVGQLVRPSMVTAIVTNVVPGGWLCLSGIRPSEVDSLKGAYGEYVDWIDEHYAELAASDTVGSIESYGFDVGTWSRLVGRVKKGGMDVEAMSELAVS